MNQDLIRIRLRWKGIAPPVERFRRGDRRAPSYDVECAVDHLASSVAALADGLESGRGWDFAALAGSRTRDLERIEAMLPALGLTRADAEPIAAYLADTRALLDAIARS